MRRLSGTESAHRWRFIPIAMSLALIMSLVMTVAPAFRNSASAGVEAGLGSITVQARICPAGYTGDDFLTDCPPTTTPITVLITPTGGETSFLDTGVDGAVTFPSLADNTYLVELGVPGDFASFYYACFDGATDEYLFDGTGNQITFDTTGGAQYYCRWYVIPVDQGVPSPSPSVVPSPSTPVGTGEIGVQVWICPANYAGDDFLTDCAPTEDEILLFLYGADGSTLEGATGEDGYEAFIQLLPQEYTLELGVPGDFADFYFACFDAATDEFLADGTTNLIDFTVSAGSSFFCRWYVIPEPQDGASPSPTARPSATARPSGVVVLPNTGTGTSAGGSSDGLQIALVTVIAAVAAVSVFGLRRLAIRNDQPHCRRASRCPLTEPKCTTRGTAQ